MKKEYVGGCPPADCQVSPDAVGAKQAIVVGIQSIPARSLLAGDFKHPVEEILDYGNLLGTRKDFADRQLHRTVSLALDGIEIAVDSAYKSELA